MEDESKHIPKTKKSTLEDFQSVLEVENLSEENFNSDILDLEASPEDIVEWWFARDPLLETLAARIPNSQPEILSFFKQTHDLYSRAALTLFASPVLQNPNNNVSKNWASHTLKKNGLDVSGNFDENFVVLANLLTSEYKRKIESGFALNKGELEQLIIAAQMIKTALSMYTSLDENNSALYKCLFDIEIITLEIVSSYVSLKESINSSPEQLKELDEIRMTALRASLMQNALMENYQSTESDTKSTEREQEIRGTALAFLVQDFRFLFANTKKNASSTLWKRLKTNTVRGTLHEALWYLDFVMLKHTYPEKYGELAIVPANSNADQPKIGKPEHRRAYDFYIRKRDVENGISKEFVQLKSAPVLSRKAGSHKTYHPLIKVVVEQNFSDVNPSRLLGKLNTYEKIVENGFTESDREQINKYVLPSVKSYIDNLE